MGVRFVRGFTLIELMVVLAILAIIMAVAIPAYQSQVRHSRRTEALQGLSNCELQQERWRADHPQFGTDVEVPCPAPSAYYTVALSNRTATTFTYTATATGDQTKDTQDGKACSSLTIDQNRTKGANVECWK